MQSVVDLLVGQIKRNDFTAVGVDANVEFAPGVDLHLYGVCFTLGAA